MPRNMCSRGIISLRNTYHCGAGSCVNAARCCGQRFDCGESVNFTNLTMFGVVRSRISLVLSPVHDCLLSLYNGIFKGLCRLRNRRYAAMAKILLRRMLCKA